MVHAGRLLDRPGQPPRDASTVLIRNGNVAAIRDGFADTAGYPGAQVVDLRDKKAPGQLTELATQLANAAAARGTREINGVLHVDEPVLVVADMWTEFADVDLVMRAMVAAKPAFRQFHYGATDFDLEERLRRGVRFDPPKAK